MTGTSIDYLGDELTVFAAASNWKRYVRRSLAPYVLGDVAEVGAGIGTTTQMLCELPGVTSWLAIEPDPAMATDLVRMEEERALPATVSIHAGVLKDLPAEPSFDTIIYIDVLEHIEDDHSELAVAVARLRPGGHIVVLCPAWPSLYTAFDKAIGHWRRYTKGTLRAVAAPGMIERKAFYLDAVGMVASLANKLVMRQSMPTIAQVKLWDRLMVPCSRLVDPIIGRTLGKSVVLIWTKAARLDQV